MAYVPRRGASDTRARGGTKLLSSEPSVSLASAGVGGACDRARQPVGAALCREIDRRHVLTGLKDERGHVVEAARLHTNERVSQDGEARVADDHLVANCGDGGRSFSQQDLQ